MSGGFLVIMRALHEVPKNAPRSIYITRGTRVSGGFLVIMRAPHEKTKREDKDGRKSYSNTDNT